MASYAIPITGEKKTLTGYVTSVENLTNMGMKLLNDV